MFDKKNPLPESFEDELRLAILKVLRQAQTKGHAISGTTYLRSFASDVEVLVPQLRWLSEQSFIEMDDRDIVITRAGLDYFESQGPGTAPSGTPGVPSRPTPSSDARAIALEE